MSEPKVPSWMHETDPHGSGRRFFKSNQDRCATYYIHGDGAATIYPYAILSPDMLRELADLIDSCQEVSGDE